MRRRFFRTAVFLIVSLFFFQAEAGPPSARQFMNRLVGEIRTALNSGNAQGANLLFAEHFDMTAFGKLCLEDHWSEFSTSERDRYVYLLDQVIRQQLKNKMLFTENDRNFTLKTDKISRRDGFIVVENTLGITKGSFKLVIFLIKDQKKLKIADYEVEGALLSRNYRGHFNYLLRKYDREAFLQKMAEKLNSISQPIAQR